MSTGPRKRGKIYLIYLIYPYSTTGKDEALERMKMEKTTSDREKQSMCETVNRTQSNLDNVQRKKDELDREVVEIKRKISELTNLHQTLRQEKDNFETQYKQAKDKVSFESSSNS